MKAARYALAAVLVAAQASPAFSWGARGHELVAEAAMSGLSSAIPAFLRTTAAKDAIVILSRELDRSRGSGMVHAERDTGHFIDLDDAGTVHGMFGLQALPQTKVDYELQLGVRGYASTEAGWLPYAVIDGWQQLAKDFAYWRASKVGAAKAKTAADRAWFATDLKVREQVIIRDIGVWGHYIGDGSQPLHVSEHYRGWPERFKDPMTYPPAGLPKEVNTVHAFYEGPFVKANIRIADVKAQMKPLRFCDCPIWKRAPDYIQATWSDVTPFYEIMAAGGLRDATPAAKAFTAKRLGAGAAEMRDLIEEAWKASSAMSVGWPNIPLADIESGKVVLDRDSYSFD